MNLRQLRYFLSVSETLNMSQTAAQLNVAQTAVGVQIRNLEDELGVDLVERHSRGIRLTPAGALFRDRIGAILGDLDKAVADVRATGQLGPPLIRLGLTPSMMGLLGEGLFDLARSVQDEMRFQFVEGLSFTLIEALGRGEINCAFAFKPPHSATLRRRALLEERLFLVTPPEPGLEGTPVSLGEALGPDLALLSSRDIVWHVVKETAAYFDIPIEIAFEVQSVQAIKSLIRRGAARSIMPLGVIADDVSKGLLSARPIDNGRLVRTLYFISADGPGGHFPRGFESSFLPRLVELYAAQLSPHVRWI